MIYRSDKWLAAVRAIPACVLCGRAGVQAAHRNEGKGLAVKADDCASAAICHDCHREIDQGPHLTREERRSRMDRAIVLTVIALARNGKVGVLAERASIRSPAAARPRSKGNTASPSKCLPRGIA